MIFVRVNIENVMVIEECSTKMEEWSGMGFNKFKSGIFFNQVFRFIFRIKSIFNLKFMDKDVFYLGFFFF